MQQDVATPDPSMPDTEEEVGVPPAAPKPLTPVEPGWALRTGLLHVLNEGMLWPMGFGLVVGREPDGRVSLVLMETNGPIVPEIDPAEHNAAHEAFVTMLANRFVPEAPDPLEAVREAARKRLVLPR